jgi:hypothetical protein
MGPLRRFIGLEGVSSGEDENIHGPFLVAWTKTCLCLELGRQGISNLQNLYWHY